MFGRRPSGDDTNAEPRGSNRRALLAVGGGILFALLAVAGYVLFFSGSGSDAMLGPVSVPGGTHAGSASPSASTSVTPAAVGTRDPFNAKGIVVQPAVATSAAAPAATTAAPSPSPKATGTPFVFKLLDLTATTVTVTVNGHSYTPKVGDSFATYFRLYAIFGTTCAGFQYQTQNLALCKGDSTVLTP